MEELNEEQQQPPVEGVTNVEGFLGEPHDTSVFRDIENHIVLRVWNGQVCKS